MMAKLVRGPHRELLAVVLLLVAGRLLEAQPAPLQHSALKGEMKVLEAVIDQTMSQTFAPPFGLLQKTKGAYLPDFGLVFSLEINLYPTRLPNPFDLRPVSKAEIDEAYKVKLQRIAAIKQSVPRLLADHASSLRHLGPDETVAVVTHFFQVQTEDDALPTQLIIEVKKLDLDQYENKALSYEQLLGKMKMSEF